MLDRRQVTVDGRRFDLEIRRRTENPPDAPRLVVVGFQPNPMAREILRLCIDSIQRNTSSPHELWVVDNASPPELSAWLADAEGVNAIFNRTPPSPPEPILARILKKPPRADAASYANAIALEIAARVVDPATQRFMALHMDTMACHPQWLEELTGHFSERCRGAGVRLDTGRVRTLHVLGMMFDFQLFEALGMNFLPQLPSLDVGDRISVALESAGYELWACPNTHVDPALVETLAPDSPFRNLHVDRALNSIGEVIFAHLGRGIVKTQGRYEGKTSPEEWIVFGRRTVLGDR